MELEIALLDNDGNVIESKKIDPDTPLYSSELIYNYDEIMRDLENTKVQMPVTEYELTKGLEEHLESLKHHDPLDFLDGIDERTRMLLVNDLTWHRFDNEEV